MLRKMKFLIISFLTLLFVRNVLGDFEKDLRECNKQFQKFIAYQVWPSADYVRPECLIFSRNDGLPEYIANYLSITYGLKDYIFCKRSYSFEKNNTATKLIAVGSEKSKNYYEKYNSNCPPDSYQLDYF